MKMKHAYEDNKKLGDPQVIIAQLDENSNHLEKLQCELKKYQAMLSEVMVTSGTPSTQKKSHSTNATTPNSLSVSHRNSVSEDSLSSRSESDTSVNNANGCNGHGNGANGTSGGGTLTNTNGGSNSSLIQGVTSLFNKLNSSTTPTDYLSPTNGQTSPFKLNGSVPLMLNGKVKDQENDSYDLCLFVYLENFILFVSYRSNSHESGISTSHLSIADAEFVDEEFDDKLMALGVAKALYPFEGTLNRLGLFKLN